MPYVANPFYAARRSASRSTRRITLATRQSTLLAEPPEAAHDRGAGPTAEWTDGPCWYVVADTGERRIRLAGPFRTRDEAGAAAPRAVVWAALRSGDEHAGGYQYRVDLQGDGRRPSVLGRAVP